MPKYLFIRTSDGAPIYGESDGSIRNAGTYGIDPSPDKKTVTIIDRLNNDKIVDLNQPISFFLKEDHTPYDSYDELNAAVATFFFRVASSGSLSNSGMLFPNTTTGFNSRMIVRSGKLCIDSELTVTGFSGSVSADDGVTGDWVNKFEFPL